MGKDSINKSKPTSGDLQTAKRIESTATVRWGTGLVVGLLAGQTAAKDGGLVEGLLVGLFVGVVFGPLVWRVPRVGNKVRFGLIGGLFFGLIGGLIQGLVTGQMGSLIGWLSAGLFFGLIGGLLGALSQWIHDGIARQQHAYRQRLLRRQEYPHVPDRALSHAELPGVPEPTPVSLSPTEPAEKEAPPRLTENVDAPAEGEKQANLRQPGGEPT